MKLTFQKVEDEAALKQCFELRHEVFVVEQNVPIEEEVDTYEDVAEHFLLLENDSPVATLRYREKTNNIVKIERVCVSLHARGKGYGREIMHQLHDYLIHKGYTKAILGAQNNAIQFYKTLGYTIVSDEFMDGGIPHHMMEVELTP